MTTKQINITVPIEWEYPEIFSSLNSYEMGFVLTMGSEMIKEARKTVANLSQKEIYDKISSEKSNEINKLELNLLVEKEVTKHLKTEFELMYKNQIETQKEKIEELTNILRDYSSENKFLIQREVNKETEKYRILLDERTNQVKRLTENYEKILQQSETKTSKKLGDEGEENFIMLSETFKDFVGYKIEKKSHQGHKGDFHLFFENFNVLVDLKNYTTSVQRKEIEKIEHDLSINDTMNFAWLISLRSNVCDWNRFPTMFKWIITDVGTKCIIIVNNFLGNSNSEESLRQLWSITNEVNKIINVKNATNEEIINYKDRDNKLSKKIKLTQVKVVELRRIINLMSQNAKDIENDLIELLNILTSDIIKNEYLKYSKIQEWWNKNIEYNTNENIKLTSTEIWSKFKKEEKEYVNENKLTVDDFKEGIKSFIDETTYTEKSKKGALEFIGFKFI
jgi:hypothetical protein